jgi:hypothetical protein
MSHTRFLKRKSSRSGPNGNSVVVQLADRGIEISDDKAGREGRTTIISLERWEELNEAASAGQHDDMSYDELGVEWFAEYGIFDGAPRFDQGEMRDFLAAVKDGEFTLAALTAPPVHAHAIVA